MGTYDSARAAWWAFRATQQTRRQLSRRSFRDLHILQPPLLPEHAWGAAEAILRWRRASCLVRSLLHQQWDLVRGVQRDLIVGVSKRDGRLIAHAWLEDEALPAGEAFTELHRRSPV